MNTTIIQLVLSCLLGFVYGFIFLIQYKKIYVDNRSFLPFFGPLSRIAFLGIAFAFLLKTPLQVALSCLTLFIISWWLSMLLLKKRIL